ncbi:hypothetical protein CR513_34606, partial [Mucuna pruriens]
MKQLATSNLEFQQSVSSSNMQFQQNMTATIQDLKTQIGQLANTLAGLSNLPSQTIPFERKCQCSHSQKWERTSPTYTAAGAEISKNRLRAKRRLTVSARESCPTAISILNHLSKEARVRRRIVEDVEINIPLLDAIKEVPKYAKFLKELCVHKRRKIKGSREIGGVVLTLTKNEELTVGTSQVLPRKCRDPGIFFVPCTIGDCTFADAMLDLGASINVIPTSFYRSLNFGDLEPTGMTIQLANRHCSTPRSSRGCSRSVVKILRSLLEALMSCLGVTNEEVDYEEVQDLPNSEDNHSNIVDLYFEVELSKLINQVYNLENPKSTTNTEVKVAETEKSPIAQLATIFMAEIKSARTGRVKGNIKVNSTKKSNSTADMLAEIVSANEDQIQAGVKIIDPFGSDSEAAQEVNADSNSTRIKATESSRPKQPQAEIMSAHLMPSQNQVGTPNAESKSSRPDGSKLSN